MPSLVEPSLFLTDAEKKTKATKRDAVITEWHAYIQTCLEKSIDWTPFQRGINAKYSKSPLDGEGILEAWTRAHWGINVRARLIKYLDQLLRNRTVQHSEAISFIARRLETIFANHDSYMIKKGVAMGEFTQCVEAVILERMTAITRQYRISHPNASNRVTLFRTYRPLLALASRFTDLASSVPMVTGPTLAIGRELAQYLATFIGELHGTGVLLNTPRVVKSQFVRVLPPFIGVLMNPAAEIAQTLTQIQQQAGFFEGADTSNVQRDMANDLSSITYQQSIIDSPLVTSRAALYIFLNAMLTGRPLCDDNALEAYLNSRYTGNSDGLIADLITASFDVLANAINRTEAAESINVYRSFLINKVPVLLETFSASIFPPSTIEQCIADALHRMDPSADPFGTQAFDLLSSSGMISEARSEFLFACALFNLIPESSIETILGEPPMQSLPESGKYNKDTLVSQCMQNEDRVETLVRELEEFEGNSSVIAAALVQIIRALCEDKDGGTLKGVCYALLKRTQALDVLLLFTPAEGILKPLCGFLDTWQDPDDPSEYHPVYEEFGAVFFLLLVLRQHFDLDINEFPIDSPNSFVRNYIANGCTPLKVNDITDSQKQKLGAWVKGLYDSENLDNDVLSSCSPKEFHMLVATLFDQTLKASQSGVLGMDTIKNGFEYLLDPFVLPSLITALGWATKVLWATRNPAPHLDHLLPLLTLLIRPPNFSSDASALHEAVLSVSARPLERALAHVQKLHPRRQDIDPLLNKLKSRVQAPRTTATSHTELENWSAAASNPQTGYGGFPAAIRHSLGALVVWSATGSLQSAPPHYTHRQVLMGIQMLGAVNVLSSLLTDALKLITSGSSQDVVIDVVSALICAPTSAKGRDTMSLRRALAIACEDAYNVSKTDASRAELIVRLHRRVQAQSPIKQQAQPVVTQDAMMMDASGQGGQIQAETVDLDGIMTGVGDDVAGGDFMDTGADGDANDLFGM